MGKPVREDSIANTTLKAVVYHTLQHFLCLIKAVNEVYCRKLLHCSCVIDMALFSMWYYKQITVWKSDEGELWKVEEP